MESFSLSALIKGGTAGLPIFSKASEGISRVSLDQHVPIGFGVVTTHSTRQALARAGKQVNRGREAAESALRMAALFKELRGQ